MDIKKKRIDDHLFIDYQNILQEFKGSENVHVCKQQIVQKIISSIKILMESHMIEWEIKTQKKYVTTTLF